MEAWRLKYPPLNDQPRRFFLPVTDNIADNNFLAEETGNYRCVSKMYCRLMVAFHHFTGLPPPYFNWDLSEPNGGVVENCTVLEITETFTIWEDWPCSTQMGFLCEIIGNIRLNLLGLCENR